MAWLSRKQRVEDRRTAAAPSPAPPARRLRRARFGDVRLWLGIALVVGSVVVGVRVMSVEDNTVLVLCATRDLASGSAAVDLAPVRVNALAAGNAYLTELPPAGDVVRWPISAGELVPRSAIASAPDVPSREVSVPVDPLHAPPGLQAGDLVDVWSAPRENEPGAPSRVLAAVTVAGVARDDVGIGGEIGVVLNVPEALVVAVVSASRFGVIDLVAVPLRSQVPAEIEAAGS